MMIVDQVKLKGIYDLHKKGHSIREISRITNIPKSTVHRHLRNTNFDDNIRVIELTDFQKKVMKMMQEGLKKKEIVEKFNPKISAIVKKEISFLNRL